jgi:serine/threonine protein kinase
LQVLLLKLIPVLLHLVRVASTQILIELNWRHAHCRNGLKKSLRVVIIDSTPVLEIVWESATMMSSSLQHKMMKMHRVYDVLCSRTPTTDSPVLHYHSNHRCIEEIMKHRVLIGYKCFLVPFGQSFALRTFEEFKKCMLSICREVQWCHENHLILHDISWSNVCMLGNEYFLVDFDDACLVDPMNNICPPVITDLNEKTHFNCHVPHSFEVDIWAIGNLILEANKEISYQTMTEQRYVGKKLMQRVEVGEEVSIDEVVELVENLPEQ